MECTFAINSTAPGIVVIQDDQSQYTINKTLQRLQQDSDKGSVNITGLPAGEYSVRVYDNNIISPATDTAAAAYEHSQLLHIMNMGPPCKYDIIDIFINYIHVHFHSQCLHFSRYYGCCGHSCHHGYTCSGGLVTCTVQSETNW